MKINKPVIQFRIGAVGGLLATAIAILSQIVSVESPDGYLSNAIVLLSISIPFMALDVYLLLSELIAEKSMKSRTRGLLRFISITLFFVAIAYVFFHFSQLAGIFFSIATVVSVVLFLVFYNTLRNR